jgi:hypothetical protein
VFEDHYSQPRGRIATAGCKETGMFHEEKTFNLKFSLEASFPDDYDGDEDNHVWVKDWEQRIKPEMTKLIFDFLRRHSAWTVHVRNRGLSPLDEIEIAMAKDYSNRSLA